MKNKLFSFLLCGVLILLMTGCGDESVLGGDEPLANPADTIFMVEMGSKTCVPVRLTVYEDGQYELFTAYETCRPGKICTSMLKYTKSIKGKTDYDVIKIIDKGNIEVDKSHSMENLPEYEIYMGHPYVEKGYGYYYSVEKGEENEYLDEFLKEIDVNLKVCAEPDYID